jgi:hypothetical protein
VITAVLDHLVSSSTRPNPPSQEAGVTTPGLNRQTQSSTRPSTNPPTREAGVTTPGLNRQTQSSTRPSTNPPTREAGVTTPGLNRLGSKKFKPLLPYELPGPNEKNENWVHYVLPGTPIIFRVFLTLKVVYGENQDGEIDDCIAQIIDDLKLTRGNKLYPCGIHYIAFTRHVFLLTIAGPRRAFSVLIDPATHTRSAALAKFLGGAKPLKCGLHLERVAGLLHNAKYELNAFTDVNPFTVHGVKHLSVHDNYLRVPLSCPQVREEELLTWEFERLPSRHDLTHKLLRGSAVNAQMSHFVGRHRAKEMKGNMGWNTLTRFYPELVEQWANIILHSIDIERLMRDGHEVEFKDASFEAEHKVLNIAQKDLSTAIRQIGMTGYITTRASQDHDFSSVGINESSAQVQLENALDEHDLVDYVWAWETYEAVTPSANSLSNLLQAGLRYTKSVNLSIFYNDPLVQLLLGSHKGPIPQVSATDYPHIAEARALGLQDGLDTSQVTAVNSVINARTIYGAVEGGPGTGKSFTAAKAFGSRPWEKRKPTRFGKPLVLVLGETNRAAFDLAKAMYREGVRIRYACSYDTFFFMQKSGEGAVLKKMRDAGYILEGWMGNEEVKGEVEKHADPEFDVLVTTVINTIRFTFAN